MQGSDHTFVSLEITLQHVKCIFVLYPSQPLASSFCGCVLIFDIYGF